MEQVGTFFADEIGAYGARPALITTSGRTVSFEELAELADDTARAWGTERRLVLIEAANEVEPIAAYLGALRKRHPVIIAAPGASEADRRIREIYKPDIVFSRSGDGWKSAIAPSPVQTSLHADLAVLLSTSGSTGDPKLVRLSRENIDSNARSITAYLELREDRAVTSLPWHYSYGMSVVNSYLANGSTLLLTEESVVGDGFWDFFREHGGTSLAGVPHTFELLERIGFRERPPPETLRYLTSAGGRLDPKLVREYARWGRSHGVALYVMYGQTEAAPRMAYLPPERAQAHPDTIGVPIPGGEFRLLAEDGGEIDGPEEVGELVYRGPNVMMGYATRREDLARGDETAELRTGDLACRTREGLYRIVGRASRFSKLFGLRINLDEVERYLAQEGLAARVSGNDELIGVCVIGESDASALEQLLAARFGLPRQAFVVCREREYPLLSSGKIDNRAILERAVRVAQERKPKAPAQSLAANAGGLRAEFADLLGVEVSPQDSFVTLGGDSMSFVQASLVVEERLGRLPEHWERMSLAELEALAREPASAARDASAGTPLQTEIMLRAAAILGVVTSHAMIHEATGGAFLLLVFAGFAFARFQRERLWEGRIVSAFGPLLLRILVPYYALLIAYAVARGGMDWHHWFLIGNFFPRLQASDGILPFYWFIENFAQIVVLFSLLFLIRPVRRASSEHPFEAGVVLLLLAFALSIATLYLVRGADQDLMHDGHFYVRTPMFTFYMFVVGWCMFFASTRGRKLVLSALAIILFPTVEIESYAVWLVAGTLAAMWIPSVTVIEPLRKIASVVAGASFYIFIAHMAPIQLVLHTLDLQTMSAKVFAALLGVGLGVGVAYVVRRAERALPVGLREKSRSEPLGTRE